jgi:lipopolysaccharide/colanic/teichoic acid biosynthesis glycosyltransferase
MLKRLFDLVASLLTAPIWLPLLVILGLLVRWKLGKPVLFQQQRPGRQGRIFTLVKFRTMLELRDSTGRLLSDGERLTGFGRWLRSTSLDELPELWNVLKGDMSLVGPRPLLIEYLPLYDAEQARRHDVPPGITGWAQINGRNAIGWTDRFRLDVWYVDHRSFLLDLKILLLTLLRVFQRRGVSAEGQATMTRFTGTPSVREQEKTAR